MFLVKYTRIREGDLGVRMKLLTSNLKVAEIRKIEATVIRKQSQYNMKSLKFRTSFSIRTRIGKRSRYINKRTLQEIKEEIPPVLIVDVDYLFSILKNKSRSKQSKIYNANLEILCSAFFDYISKAVSCIAPSGVIYTSTNATEVHKKLNLPIYYTNLSDFVFSIRLHNTIPQRIVILSNNITTWILSSKEANLSFLAFDTNSRPLYYNNKTGLDIVSKFIGTYKIINKLNLDTLKYINLQYLFLLLFYISVTHKTKEEFYFDGKYFKQLGSKPFLKSKGFGFELVTEAHKYLSYAFLTKPEFLDYFLLGDMAHYNLQLQRLAKLMSMDEILLIKLKTFYDSDFKPKEIDTTDVNYTDLGMPEEYKKLVSLNFDCSDYIEYKHFSKLVRRYVSLYPMYLTAEVLEQLPKNLRPAINITSKPVDTNNDILDYVSNLIDSIY